MRSNPILKNKQNFGIYLILLELILLGGALRVYPLLRSNFPVNDGGMFYTMTQDLIENKFILPTYTTYNRENIPYGYPPLPFYLAATLSTFWGINLLTILRFLPAFISILTIPVFFGFSRELLNNLSQAFYATLAFALAAPSYEWLIMGGGLTRAPAYLFSLLALLYGVRALKSHKRIAILLTCLFSGLAGYCHLEILWTTFGFLIIAAFYLSRNRFGLFFISLLIVSVGIILSPYVLYVVFHHGLQPFVAALSSGEFEWAKSIGKLLLDNISGEYLFTPIIILALVGLLYCFQKKQFILPAWILATVILNPRSMERSLIIPLTLLAGIAMTNVIIPGILDRMHANHQATTDLDHQSMSTLMRDLMPTKIGAFLITYMFIRSAVTGQVFVVGLDVTLNSLSTGDRAAMQWIANNIDPDGRFLVLTPPSNWQVNEVTEWFPALSKRNSLITVQGSEWLPDNTFNRRREIYDEMILCPIDSLNCVQQVAEKYYLSYTHIYLSGKLENYDVQFPLPMEGELFDSQDYKLIYQQDGVLIFTKNPG